MSYFFLIPISIILGLTGLCAFFWAMRHNQYDDLEGAAARILITLDQPLPPSPSTKTTRIAPIKANDLTRNPVQTETIVRAL